MFSLSPSLPLAAPSTCPVPSNQAVSSPEREHHRGVRNQVLPAIGDVEVLQVYVLTPRGSGIANDLREVTPGEGLSLSLKNINAVVFESAS